MAYSSQSFTAPSIPKLNRRTISSPLSSSASKISAAAPKLKTSRMRFFRPSLKNTNVTAEAITQKSSIENTLVEAITQKSSIENTLVETNTILVEIQKQLAYDFAMRIAEEKEKNKVLKSDKSRRRLALKEGAVESTKKIGNIVKSATGKILAPVKGVFDNIIEFLSIIGTGIAVNAAFEWLSKEENREQLGEWFGWVAKNWKWVAATVGGILLLKPILSVIGAIGGAVTLLKTAFQILRFAKRKIFGGGGPKPSKTPKPSGGGISGGSNTTLNYGRNVDPKTGAPLRSAGSISRYNASMARDIQGKANLGDKARLFFKNRFNLGGMKSVPKLGALSSILLSGADFTMRKFQGQSNIQAAVGTGGGLAGALAGGAAGAKGGAAIGAGIGAFFGGVGAAPGAAIGGTIGGILGSIAGGMAGAGIADKVTGVEARAMGGPVKAGNPYIVGEKGPEFFIPNINGSVVNNYKTEKIYQMISSKNAGKINFITMDLPPQVIKKEKSIPTPPAPPVPNISSTNAADLWRVKTPDIYGIYV